MAAPMLLASVIPLSTTLPVVTWVIKGPVPLRDRMTAPDPVVVHCAVGGFCPPYSRGLRYWRSAEQKNGRRSEPLRRKQSRRPPAWPPETSLPPWWSRRRIGRKKGRSVPGGSRRWQCTDSAGLRQRHSPIDRMKSPLCPGHRKGPASALPSLLSPSFFQRSCHPGWRSQSSGPGDLVPLSSLRHCQSRQWREGK